jgi:hypothetical protein
MCSRSSSSSRTPTANVADANLPTDIAACWLLLSQLGYDLNPQEVKRRYEAITAKQDHTIFVGEQDGQVVALLHLYERPAFDKPPEVIVQGTRSNASAVHESGV